MLIQKEYEKFVVYTNYNKIRSYIINNNSRDNLQVHLRNIFRYEISNIDNWLTHII
jgi:hypothetical protein